MGKRLLLTLSVFLLVSCTVPETKIYSIYMGDTTSSVPGKGAFSAAVSVESPKYLSQPYLACRNSPYQIEISKYSKWDSSPSEIIRDASRDLLLSAGPFREVRSSIAAPAGFHQFRVKLKRFEKYSEGDVSYGELAFDIDLISPEGKELFHRAVSKKVRIEGNTNLGLAKGLSNALLEALAELKPDLVKSLGK